MISWSDIIYLSNQDLIGYTKDELRIARNEIYARQGRMFNSDNLQTYFNTKVWYYPQIPANQFKEFILNEVEKYNVALIKKHENNMK